MLQYDGQGLYYFLPLPGRSSVLHASFSACYRGQISADDSPKIASARVHIKRVVRRVKVFPILENEFFLTLVVPDAFL